MDDIVPERALARAEAELDCAVAPNERVVVPKRIAFDCAAFRAAGAGDRISAEIKPGLAVTIKKIFAQRNFGARFSGDFAGELDADNIVAGNVLLDKDARAAIL